MTTTIETPSVIRHLWKSVLSLGVLTLILGAAVLVWPGQSIVVAGILFVVYLLASGIAQVIAAFTVNSPAASRVLLFISGALSIALGVFAFRDYDDGAAVWLLALWIGVGFMFQGVSETALAISFKELPERGWYIFVGVLTVIAGVVMLAWPISSIVVLSIIAGVWLVVIGTTEIVWAVNVRSEAKKVRARCRVAERAAPSPDSPIGVLRRSGASQHAEPSPEKPYTPTPMNRLAAGAVHDVAPDRRGEQPEITEAAINSPQLMPAHSLEPSSAGRTVKIHHPGRLGVVRTRQPTPPDELPFSSTPISRNCPESTDSIEP